MKSVKKIIVSILVICVSMQMMAAGVKVNNPSADSEKVSETDPYGLMYDSNEALAERIESMPDLVSTEQESENGATDSNEKTQNGLDSNQNDTASDNEPKDETKKKDEVLQLVQEGNVEGINDLDISDTAKEQINQVNEDVKEDRYIVKYLSDSKGNLSEMVGKKNGEAGVKSKDRSGKIEVLVLDEKVNPKDLAETLKEAGADKYIEYIQPDFKMGYSATDEGLSLTVSEDDVNNEGEEVSEIERTEEDAAGEQALDDKLAGVQLSEVTVAVIDTGIDITHTGLADYIWSNADEIADDGIDNDGNGYIDDTTGWDFYNESESVYDAAYPLQSAHGTHIAGIIAATNEDFDVKIMPLKVFGENGAYTSDIIEAINYAEANGAKIVNCSFGSTDNNPALEEAIANSGMLFVCAVGNARTNIEITPVYPACFDLDNVISVTSTNADGGLSYFSNYSSNLVDVAALGRDVSSTLPNGEYGLQSGTSMSAAQVSGVAAAALSVDNDMNSSDLKNRLILTSDMLSNLQETVRDGRQINLANAVLNNEQTQIQQNTPADDFDVTGYNPTQDELYQLYTNSGDVVQTSTGGYYALVLKENGTVWAWGSNEYGQCGNGTTSFSEALTQVLGLTNVVSVAAGGYHCLALKGDGTVWSWGYNVRGELGNGTTTNSPTPVQVSGITNVTNISGGLYHSLAIKTDGSAWSWGYNNDGELGNGTTTNSTTPVQVSGLTNATKIAAGGYHSLAVKTDGTVWAWGYNGHGELGNGSTTKSTIPVQASGLTNVASIAGAGYHSLAVKTDGTVWAWGYNNCGQLGNGTTTSSTTPVQVSGLADIGSISAGYSHSLAMKTDGTVWAWGYNGDGQLGNNTTTNSPTPVQVSGLSNVASIAGGFYHSFAVKTDGTIWTFGCNNRDQLGTSATSTRAVPVQVSGLTNAVTVTAGNLFSVTVKSDGTVWAWGSNSYGQLGNGTTTTQSTPVLVSGLTNVVSVAAGGSHCLALKADGTVWSWGYNGDGQLGNNTTTNSTTPVQVSGLTNVASIAAGAYHSLAIKTDGTVWSWGYNGHGELGNGTTTKSPTPVQVSGLTNVASIEGGYYHSLAVKTDGTVWSWGYNNYGQLGNGTKTNSTTPVQASGLTDITRIAGGCFHTLAVKSDGTVWTWGYNYDGELGNGTTTNSTTPVQVSGLTNVTSIAGGFYHNLAVKTDGTVWAWGYNGHGELGNGTLTNSPTPVQASSLANATSIAGGYYHSLAVKTDGNISAWGSDSYWQLGITRISNSATPMKCYASSSQSLAFISNLYSATIPSTGTRTVTVSAQAINGFGDVIENAAIVYGFDSTYNGVSINSSTGVITVSSSAQAGSVQLTATYAGHSCNATLNITLLGPTLTISATVNKAYNIALSASNITSFDGITYTLTYDSSNLELTDLCAFTFTTELSTGAILGTDIVITSVSPGTIVFTVNKTIASEKKWSGVLNVFKFTALSAGNTTLSIQ